jgi:predicted membrane metal-binding protein
MVNDYWSTREQELISCLGISLLMFCGTVWVLVFGRGRAKINKLMLSVAILFLLFSTTVSVKRLPNILDVSYSQIPIIGNYFRHNSPRRRPRITT